MHYQRIVVKLGTSTLTAGTPNINLPRLFDLVCQIVKVHSEGCQIVLVTSGAMAAGREVLNFLELPKFMPKKQMLSAIGQPHLMSLYDQFFRMYGKIVAQVLLTRDDLSDRSRYLNARDTLEALLTQKVIPIINENDTVATEEIRFGDNDNLSAQVANLIEADLLILLTDQPGLFTSDPRRDANAQLIPAITEREIASEMWEAADGSSNGLGTGGMATKLQAADLARRAGITVIIADGGQKDIINRIANQDPVGTTIFPLVNKLEGRKRFLLARKRAAGRLTVDAGAVQALLSGSSLLPVGLVTIEGKFERGDTVRVISSPGKEIALGLVNYPAQDLTLLKGHKSGEIESILGFSFGDEVIHRSNMILL
jgi:glutamate 5-kinase